MELSLTDAAGVLGKTPRQVRYLIRTGRLKARKVGTRWVIDADDLPIPPGQLEAAQSRADSVRRAMETATASVTRAGDQAAAVEKEKRRFSVRDLRAYASGSPVYRKVVAALGADDLASRALERSFHRLAQGCHAFQPETKGGHYRAAREEAASAVMFLLLGGAEDDALRLGFADALEQGFLGDLTSLIRVTERRAHRHRARQYGASLPPMGRP